MSIEERERAAGLRLAGNDTMSGRGGKTPTMAEREAAAGLNLAGNDTMSGRKGNLNSVKLAEETAGKGTFGIKGRLAGEPRPQRDSEDMVETVEVRRSGGGSQTHPLQLVRSGNKLYVRKGTVGGIVPTISDTPLDDDYLENELSWSGTSTFWLKCTVDDSDDSTTDVEITTTDPGANTATQAKLGLGSVTMDGSDIDSFSINLTGSQERAGCGTSHYFGVI